MKSSRGGESQRVLSRGGGLPSPFPRHSSSRRIHLPHHQKVRDRRASETLPYSVFVYHSDVGHILKAERFSPELVQGPPPLLGKTGALRPTHFKTEGKVLQSLFWRGLWRYATV